MNDRLKIIAVSKSNKNHRKSIQEAKYEQKWLESPDLYEPSILEQVTIERILNCIDFSSLQKKLVADIGCGWGFLAKKLCKAKANCDACDIAANALKRLPQLPNLHPIQTSLPETSLADNAYDLVLCCDTIAELDPRDYRLAMAELCRILKIKGEIILSTPIDLYSQDALERFFKLVGTEFSIVDSKFSYHFLYIKLFNFTEKPIKYWTGYKNPPYRKEKLSQLSPFSKFWFLMNTSFPLAWFWGGIQWISLFLQKVLFERKAFLLLLEKWSYFFWDKRAISHVIVTCVRKPLIQENHLSKGRPDRPPFLKERRWE